jgi:hypothetical protein
LSDDHHDDLAFIRDRLAKSRTSLIFVVGSGVSLAATGGAPAASWRGLLVGGVKKLSIQGRIDDFESADITRLIDANEFLEAATRIERGFGNVSGIFANWLRDTVGALRAKDPTLIQAILDLGAPIITTNYDGLLESLDGRPVVTPADGVKAIEAAVHGQTKGIVHIHGHWEKPHTIVLGQDSYDKLKQDSLIQKLLAALASTPMVFIGCGQAGLNDPNVGRLLKDFSTDYDGQLEHYLLVSQDEVPALKNSRWSYLDRRVYGATRDALPSALARLISVGAPAGLCLPATPPVALTDADRSRFDALLAAHIAAFDAGDMPQALALIDECGAMDPGNAAVLRHWVKAAIRWQQAPAAIRARIDDFRAAYGDSSLVRLAQAELCRQQGFFKEAIDCLHDDALHPETPLYSVVLFELASAYLSKACQEQHSSSAAVNEARRCFEKSRSFGKSRRYWVDINVALCRRLVNQPDEILEQDVAALLDEYIAAHPKKWSARVYRVYLCAIRDRVDLLLQAKKADVAASGKRDRYSYAELDTIEPRIRLLYEAQPEVRRNYQRLFREWAALWD